MFVVQRPLQIFGEFNQRLKAAGYFPRRAPWWISDRILNATLPNNLLQLAKGLRRIKLNQIKLAKLISTFCHCRNISSIHLLSNIYIFDIILWWLSFWFWFYWCWVHLLCRASILSEKAKHCKKKLNLRCCRGSTSILVKTKRKKKKDENGMHLVFYKIAY